MKILNLHEHGLKPIGERTTDANGNATQEFEAKLIRVGSFSHPTAGWELEVTQSRLRHWLETAKRIIANGNPIPIRAVHESADAADSLGFINDLSIEGDWLIGKAQMIGDDAIAAAARNYISVEIDEDYADGLGNKYGDAIYAIALTPTPVVTGQQRIAASVNGSTRQARVYLLDQRARSGETAAEATNRLIAMANGVADENWEDQTRRILAMDNNDVSPATRRIIDRATQDVEKLAMRLKRHSVEDFELAADALGMETGTKLLDSLGDENKLVLKLVQRIKQLEATAMAQANIADSMSKASDKPARQDGVPEVKALSIVRWVDDRGDHHDLSAAQSKRLRDEMRARARAMSLESQRPAETADEAVTRIAQAEPAFAI